MSKRSIRNGPPDTSLAWLAGWDASITGQANPYKRRDYASAFERGRIHGKRSDDEAVRILNLMLSRRSGERLNRAIREEGFHQRIHR
jgi:hypothetical protein